MTRLEVIHLRLAGTGPAGLGDEVLRAVAGRAAPRTARVFRHATVPGDLVIHLQDQPQGGAGRPTALGVQLAAALREHGMVEHTVWIELEQQPRWGTA
jgi:hypothetical protein